MRFGARHLWAIVCLGFTTSCSLVLPFEQCEGNSDCAGGEVCVLASQTCRSITTDECSDVVGAYDEDDAQWIGIILPLSGTNAESGVYVLGAMSHALDEINQLGGPGGNQSAKLAALVCDDAGEAEQGVLVAQHLVDTLQVPAFLGPAYSKVSLEVAREVAIPNDTLMILPSSTATQLSTLDDNDLVWRTAPPDTYQADTLAYYATWQILERFGSQGAAPGGQAQALTFSATYSEDVYGEGLYSEFRTRLLSNLEWLTLNSLQPAIRFVVAPYDSNDATSITASIDEFIASDPDIAVVIGYEETADIFEAIRDDEVARSAAYFVTDGVRSDAVRTLFDSEDEKPEFLFGVAPTSREGAVFEAFAAAYTEIYGGSTPPVWTEHAYDATYLLAYAMAGAPEDPTGGDLAEAMKRAVDVNGRSVRVGTGDFLAATTEMGTGGTLLVEGASGVLDLDPAVGDRQTASVLRWDIDTDADAYQDCGVATSYSTDGVDRDWCAARCLEEADDCIPDVFAAD